MAHGTDRHKKRGEFLRVELSEAGAFRLQERQTIRFVHLNTGQNNPGRSPIYDILEIWSRIKYLHISEDLAAISTPSRAIDIDRQPRQCPARC